MKKGTIVFVPGEKKIYIARLEIATKKKGQDVWWLLDPLELLRLDDPDRARAYDALSSLSIREQFRAATDLEVVLYWPEPDKLVIDKDQFGVWRFVKVNKYK